MELDRAAFKPLVSGQQNYCIDNSHNAVSNTRSWQKSVVIMSIALMVTGIVFLILSSAVPIAPAAIAALTILGQRLIELSAYSLLITGLSLVIHRTFMMKARQREAIKNQPILKRKVSLHPDNNHESMDTKVINKDVYKNRKSF